MFIKMLEYIAVYAATLMVAAQYVSGLHVEDWYSAAIVAVLWGVIGFTLRPVLNLLALPVNLLTLGLFSFVINALLFWFLATFVAGFTVSGFVPALVGSLILTVVGWLLHTFFKR